MKPFLKLSNVDFTMSIFTLSYNILTIWYMILTNRTIWINDNYLWYAIDVLHMFRGQHLTRSKLSVAFKRIFRTHQILILSCHNNAVNLNMGVSHCVTNWTFGLTSKGNNKSVEKELSVNFFSAKMSCNLIKNIESTYFALIL